MTYLRRALKYFIYITLMLAIILGILMALGMVFTNIDVTFQHGWKSVWWILGLFAAMSFVYPFFGYQKRKILISGDPGEHRDGIVEALRTRGYVQEERTDGVLSFHLASPFYRAARLWEDRITLTPVLGGWEAEGLTRDLVRVVSSIEHQLRSHGND